MIVWPSEDGGVGPQDRDEKNPLDRMLTSLELGINSGGRESGARQQFPVAQA